MSAISERHPAFEGVAPLHAAQTPHRDVPTTLNRYEPEVSQNDYGKIGRFIGFTFRVRSSYFGSRMGNRHAARVEDVVRGSKNVFANPLEAFEPDAVRKPIDPEIDYGTCRYH